METCSFRPPKGFSENKEDIYKILIDQIALFFKEEEDLIANLANTAAFMKTIPLPFFWVGFYLVKAKELVLGPFQGSPATSRISFGKGVCGKAWKERKTILVPDVHLFPGHIACSSLSQSEIVVPIFADNEIIAVLDIDSDRENDFDTTDALYLEKIAEIIGLNWHKNKIL